MNTKYLMASSAAFLALISFGLTFLPEETMRYYATPSPEGTLTLQLLGAAYFGYAMLNWMAKGNLIGGIYSKPVAMANVAHFGIGSITLLKLGIETPGGNLVLWGATAAYSVFAVLFYKVSFTHPGSRSRFA